MKRVIALLAVLLPTTAAEQPNRLTPKERKEGYILLFNGKDLTGWEGDPAYWSVKDGAIVGSTHPRPLKTSSFLVGKQEFSDFILKVDLKLLSSNSGVQFRSTAQPEWQMTGYQADASDVGPKSAWGNLYEMNGRGRGIMKSTDEGWLKAREVVRTGDWNQYEILAVGKHIQLKLNGIVTIDMEDDKSARGLFGVQLHPGPGMEVQLRNIKLKVLR